MTKPAIEMHTDGTPNAREWQSGCDVTFISEPIKIVLPKTKRAIGKSDDVLLQHPVQQPLDFFFAIRWESSCLLTNRG